MKKLLVFISFAKRKIIRSMKVCEWLNKSSNKRSSEQRKSSNKKVMNNASLVTYWLVLIDQFVTLIGIITELTLLVDKNDINDGGVYIQMENPRNNTNIIMT